MIHCINSTIDGDGFQGKAIRPYDEICIATGDVGSSLAWNRLLWFDERFKICINGIGNRLGKLVLFEFQHTISSRLWHDDALRTMLITIRQVIFQ
ncbi:hypothetical protein AVEN_34776-1 [Araneus ventricosus]|uniref:Uncharacterized protein n=1 Tax=Araneus ventricosus TaxID=182803 RepID=A0A4Y2MXY2_ARAVE|nr:hypothetical protein AVEN_34776-1 [Araneus ventricosus]